MGRYRGLKQIKVGDTNGDHLDLEYAGGDRLYLPVDLIDLVQKYVRVDSRPPTLDSLGKPGRQPRTYWLEALPNADDWPGIGKFPPEPSRAAAEAAREQWSATNRAAREEWRRACHAYKQALHADPSYRQATREFLERQRREPQPLRGTLWAYRDKILGLESTEPENLRDRETDILLVKHYVLRQERQYERVRREVEALENLETLEGVAREPIPESVRLFVWQRDRGRCVKCGSRERLEFDHIIPVVAGGSSTERNIQLLCESCNRSKGSTI